MSEVPSVTGHQALGAFRRLGFEVVRITGSHHIMKRPGHRYNLAIPVHKGEILKKGTLRWLIRAAGVSIEEFVAALG